MDYLRSLEPVNAGTLVWQLNDDWPVISWAAVDYDGHRKPLCFSLARFLRSSSSIQPEVSEAYRAEYSWAGMPVTTDQLALVMVNDTRRAWEVQWGWSAAALMEPFWPLKLPGSLIGRGAGPGGSGGRRGHLLWPRPGDSGVQPRPARFC